MAPTAHSATPAASSLPANQATRKPASVPTCQPTRTSAVLRPPDPDPHLSVRRLEPRGQYHRSATAPRGPEVCPQKHLGTSRPGSRTEYRGEALAEKMYGMQRMSKGKCCGTRRSLRAGPAEIQRLIPESKGWRGRWVGIRRVGNGRYGRSRREARPIRRPQSDQRPCLEWRARRVRRLLPRWHAICTAGHVGVVRTRLEMQKHGCGTRGLHGGRRAHSRQGELFSRRHRLERREYEERPITKHNFVPNRQSISVINRLNFSSPYLHDSPSHRLLHLKMGVIF